MKTSRKWNRNLQFFSRIYYVYSIQYVIRTLKTCTTAALLSFYMVRVSFRLQLTKVPDYAMQICMVYRGIGDAAIQMVTPSSKRIKAAVYHIIKWYISSSLIIVLLWCFVVCLLETIVKCCDMQIYVGLHPTSVIRRFRPGSPSGA